MLEKEGGGVGASGMALAVDDGVVMPGGSLLVSFEF